MNQSVSIAGVKIDCKEPKVAGVVGGEDIIKLSSKAKDMGADIIEVRWDMFEDYSDFSHLDKIRTIKDETGLPILLTIRRIEEAGLFDGTEEQRKEIFKEVMSHVDAIDIEYNANEIIEDVISEARKDDNKTVIVSYHELTKTPTMEKLYDRADQMSELNPDILKLAAMARSDDDVERMLKFTCKFPDMLMTTISLGNRGSISRILFPFFGSCITYGFVDESNAPGQLPVSILKEGLTTSKDKIMSMTSAAFELKVPKEVLFA